MGLHGKPGGCDAGFVQGIANHHKDKSTLKPIDAPPGFTILPEAEAEEVKTLVGLYLADADPDCMVEFEPGDSDTRGVAFVLTQPRSTGEPKTFYVHGWRPRPRIEVVGLYAALDSIYHSDSVQGAVVCLLGDRRQVRAMASSYRDWRETARDLQGEMDARSAICLEYLDLLSDPLNWMGPVPATAKIYLKLEKR